MALLGNHSVLNKNPGRAFGPFPADGRHVTLKTGTARGRFTGWADYSPLAATPNGHLPNSSWVLPITGGGMSSYTLIDGVGAFAASGTAGLNAIAALDGSGAIITAIGQLVVSAQAALTGSGTIATAGLQAVLQAAANLAGVGTLNGTIRADAALTADLAGLGTLAATVRAIGSLSADLVLTSTDTLTAVQVANAVWSVVAEEVNATGTTGEALGLAIKILRNRRQQDPTDGTVTVFDDDGVTPLLVGIAYEDIAGTQTYQGDGADRVDRLD